MKYCRVCTPDGKVCGREAIGEQTFQEFWGSYITIDVCDKHAWPVLKKARPGEEGYGISIGWTRW